MSGVQVQRRSEQAPGGLRGPDPQALHLPTVSIPPAAATQLPPLGTASAPAAPGQNSLFLSLHQTQAPQACF